MLYGSIYSSFTVCEKTFAQINEARMVSVIRYFLNKLRLALSQVLVSYNLFDCKDFQLILGTDGTFLSYFLQNMYAEQRKAFVSYHCGSFTILILVRTDSFLV